MGSICSERRRRAWRGASAALLTLCWFASAQGQATKPDGKDRETELKQLRTRIETIRKDLQADARRRDALADDVRAADLAVQAARVKAQDIQAQRQASEERLANLKRERATTEREIARERASLAAELRAAYMTGREEPLRLLLNQEDPAAIARMSTYYGYFARARAERISAISDRLAHLDLLEERMSAETERLKALEAEQRAQAQSLSEARAKRAQTLASIQAKMRSRSDQAAALERQAKALQRLIEEMQRAARELPALPARGFGRAQGKLPWPVTGKLLAQFGESRGGGPLKWEGILIGAPAGTPVRALFHGRVVYADHLYGMGLMVMIDHGDGYSSIYGHQEQLYCKVGDTVAPGDVLGVLAERPNGGGELHLEIRKGRDALDPRRWLRRP